MIREGAGGAFHYGGAYRAAHPLPNLAIARFDLPQAALGCRALIGDYLVAADDDLGLTPPGYQLPSLPGLGAEFLSRSHLTQPPWERFEWVSMDFALSNLNLRAMAEEIREQLLEHLPR